MKQKILIISEVFHPEDTLISDLAKHWEENGFEIHVLTRNPSYPFGKVYNRYKNRLFQKEVFNNIIINRIHVIQGYRDNRTLKIFNYLWNMILATIWILYKGRGFNHIFIHHTGPLTFAFPGAIAARLYKIKTTIWTMDVWPDTVYAYGICKNKISSYILEKFVSWIYKYIENIIVSSPGFIQSVELFAKNKNIQFIPQWSRTNFESEAEIELPGSFNFLFAGNIGKAQNIEAIIYGFSDMINKNIAFNNCYLKIIGDGSKLKILKSIVQNNNFKNIKFWGRRPLSEMPAFFNAGDILIISLADIPIFNKTIPAKFQSYIHASKPIFSISNGIINRIIEEENIGWHCKPESTILISQKFQEIFFEKKEKIKQRGLNAKKLYVNNYSKENILIKLTNYIS